jgi:hypothetical protein
MRAAFWLLVIGLSLINAACHRGVRASRSAIVSDGDKGAIVAPSTRLATATWPPERRLLCPWFTTKGKIKYTSPDESHNLTYNLRLHRGQAIWLSISGPLGLEVMRLLITPDTLYLHDRINGEHRQYDYPSLATLLGGYPVTYAGIEALILGNMPLSSAEGLVVSAAPQGYQLTAPPPQGSLAITLDSTRQRMVAVTDRAFAMQLADFTLPQGYAASRQITLGTNSPTQIVVTHAKAECPAGPLALPFTHRPAK